jgi:hypothetical protein
MKYAFTLFTLSILFLNSCKESNPEDRYVPPSSGTHAELLIVASDTLWRGKVGEALREAFLSEQYGLPQSEGIFSVNRIRPEAFNSILTEAKSVVFAEIGDTSLVELKRNVWAKPQLVATLIAPNRNELSRLIRANADEMVDQFHSADLGVIRGRMAGTTYKKLPKGLKEFGIAKMTLSSGFEPTVEKEDIHIYRQETKKTQQFLVFSKRAMRDDLLPGQDIIEVRDSIGKNYFEGAVDGSYFGTETLLPPQQRTTEIDGQFAIETRGLWKTFGDFMGGPFLSYTIYNDATNEVICVEGFIYGPDARKRNIMLEMEAMMRSITFK